MTLASKLKLSVFYDIISPHCLPIFNELSNDITFKKVQLDLKPVAAPNMDLLYSSFSNNMLSSINSDVKFINALYNVNMIIPDNWNEIWLENKTEHIQNFLANLSNVNKENNNDLIAFNLKLLRLFWIEKKTLIDENALKSLAGNFKNLNTNFDLTDNKELEENIRIASKENAIDIPFFVLTAPKNRRYTYRGYESLPIIRHDIILQNDRLNTILCNL